MKNRFEKVNKSVDKTTYEARHAWIKKVCGKANHCELEKTHKSKYFEWHNKNGQYNRQVKEWIQLCISCHKKIEFTKERRAKYKINIELKKYKTKKIKQYNKNHTLIKEFKSIGIAHRITKVSRTAISNVLAGRAKTAGGYIWEI